MIDHTRTLGYPKESQHTVKRKSRSSGTELTLGRFWPWEMDLPGFPKEPKDESDDEEE